MSYLKEPRFIARMPLDCSTSHAETYSRPRCDHIEFHKHDRRRRPLDRQQSTRFPISVKYQRYGQKPVPGIIIPGVVPMGYMLRLGCSEFKICGAIRWLKYVHT